MRKSRIGIMVLGVLFFLLLTFGVSWGQPTMLIVVRASDDSLWKMTRDEVACSPFSNFPGLFRYQPTVSWEEKAQEWVVVGTASDHSIWMATFDKNGVFNNDWQSIPGLTPSPSGASGSYYTLGGLSCAAGEIPRWSGSVWECSSDNDSGGTATEVNSGVGLTGGPITGSGTLSVSFSGTGVANTVSRSDHHHDAVYVNEGQASSITSAMIVDGAVGTVDLANQSVTQGKLSATGGTSGQVLSTDGTNLLWQTPASGWGLTGNAGTDPSTNFIGTTDNQELRFRVNNAVAFRIVPDSMSPNIIGGQSGNWITAGVYGATIGGGGQSGWNNRVTDSWGTVGGDGITRLETMLEQSETRAAPPWEEGG